MIDHQHLGEPAKRKMPRHEDAQLDDLAFVEMPAQALEGAVIDGVVIGGEEFGVFDGRFLGIAVQIAVAESADPLVKRFGGDLSRARREPGAQSDRTVVGDGDPVAHQFGEAVRQRAVVVHGDAQCLQRGTVRRAQREYPVALRGFAFWDSYSRHRQPLSSLWYRLVLAYMQGSGKVNGILRSCLAGVSSEGAGWLWMQRELPSKKQSHWLNGFSRFTVL